VYARQGENLGGASLRGRGVKSGISVQVDSYGVFGGLFFRRSFWTSEKMAVLGGLIESGSKRKSVA
jgi:hypothetical protein